MSGQTLPLAEAAYDLATRAAFRRVEVADDEVDLFLEALAALEATANRDDELIDQLIRRLRRIRFDVLSTPLPFSDGVLDLIGRAAQLEAFAGPIEDTHPSAANSARGCIFRLRQLARSDANPLGDAIAATCKAEGPSAVAVILRNTRASTGVARLLQTLGPDEMQMTVLAGPAPRPEAVSDLVLVVGPFKWFPAFVVESPMAPVLVSVTYLSVRESSLADLRLPGSSRSPRSLLVDKANIGTKSASPVQLDAEAVVPFTDWSALVGTSGQSSRHGDDEERLASAFVLAGGYGVLLDGSDGATCLILDLDALNQADRLRRIETSLLEPGMFAVLRTEGGGDYVAEVADRMLGDAATKLRSDQRDWKARLRSLIKRNGIATTLRTLKSHGGVHVSHANLRRWISPDSLRTEDEADFQAILSTVGLADQFARYWTAMGHLQSAHQAAGNRIRKMLLQQISDADVVRGRDQGRIDFALQEELGGTLSAFRVEDRSQDPIVVMHSRLNRLFELDDY